MVVASSDVLKLRQTTGAGILDCKKALEEAGGNLEEAIKILRAKGIAKAEKKASRQTSQGVIASYIHLGGKLGVLIEVNCETDFVARCDDFSNLVRDLAMQVAAANPLYIKRENVPSEVIEKEKEIYRAQCVGKPAQVVDKIVEGKLEKYYQETCLLEQPFIRDDKINVEQYIKQAIAKIGENIVVKRFTRYKLGEE